MPRFCVMYAARISAMLLAGVSPLALAGKAEAQGRHRFDIPSQPVGASLRAFARQSGRQVLFPYDAVVGKQAPRINGVFEDEEVIQRLARAAGLVISSSDGRTITLALRPRSEAAPLFHGLEPAPPLEPAVVAEVLVTALKRTEPLSRAPASISVLDGEAMAERGVVNLAGLENVAPGVSVNRVAHGLSLSIRGVSTTDNTSKGEQGVALNIDGVFIGRPIEQGLSLFDIERVEVVRGPQGTLYGKSSTGGAINVITRKPVDWFEAYARLEAGDFNARRAEGAINVPLSDRLAIRLAGDLNRREGVYWPADGGQRKGDQSDEALRLTALGRPAPDVTVRATLTTAHVGGAGPGYANLDAFIAADGAARRRVLGTPFTAGLDHRVFNLDGEIEARAGDVLVTYVGARHRFDADEATASNNDPVGNHQGPPPVVPVYDHARYRAHIGAELHELRIANAFPGAIDYVAGLNVYRERVRERDHEWGAPVDDPVPAASLNQLDIIGVTRHASYGAFGQATAHLSDRWGVVAGLRYSNDRVERRGTIAIGPAAPDGTPWSDANGAPCVAPADCIGVPNNGRQSAGKLTYRLGLNYQAGDTGFFYGSVATGYKAGGFNDVDLATRAPAPYAPEELTAYELGYKGQPLADLRLQASLFYYDYAGAQISSAVQVPNANPVIYTRLEPARIVGFEGEANWRVSPDLSLELTLALERSRYDRLRAGFLQDVDWSGQPMDRTPRAVATVAVNRRWALGRGWSAKLRASSKFSAAYYVSDFIGPYRFRQKAFTRSDLTLTLLAPESRWYAQVFAQNLENDLQAVGAPGTYSAAVPAGVTMSTSDPRFVGMRIGMSLN